MTKTLSMVSHKNYNLNAKWGFCHFLTSKLITCFIEGFTLRRKSQSIAYLLNGSEHSVYIGFWTLKPKCTQYGLYGWATFKMLGSGRAKVGHARVRGPRLWLFWCCPCPLLWHMQHSSGVFREPITFQGNQTTPYRYIVQHFQRKL